MLVELGLVEQRRRRSQRCWYGVRGALCRLWDQATIGTGAVFDKSMSRRADPGQSSPVPGESRAEHPFGGLEVAAPRQHDDEQPADA